MKFRAGFELQVEKRRYQPHIAMAYENHAGATVGAIQNNFRKYAEKIPWIDVGEYNPARPHSLRAAFRSRLTGKMDPDLIEFFMGHSVGPV